MTKLLFPYSLPSVICINSEKEELKILSLLHVYGFKWNDGSLTTDFTAFIDSAFYLKLHSNFVLTYMDHHNFLTDSTQSTLLHKHEIEQL